MDREVIRFKLVFFADQVKRTQELLEDVKEKDSQLRSLLNMESKKQIITTVNKNEGKGGPTERDVNYLNKYLSNRTFVIQSKIISKAYIYSRNFLFLLIIFLAFSCNKKITPQPILLIIISPLNCLLLRFI